MKGRVRLTMRFPVLGFAVALTTAGTLGTGCDATRRDWSTCNKESCAPGFMCTDLQQCVPTVDGGAWDGNQADAPQGIDGASVSGAIDGSSIDLSAVDSSDDVPVSIGPVDGAVALDSATEAGQASLVDAGALDAGAVDINTPDAARTCASDNDCTSTGAPYCVQTRCASCKTGDQCGGGVPICSASHTCVSCAVIDAGCPAATPACEADSGRCMECLGDTDCVRDAMKSFCQAGLCVGCAEAGALACTMRNPAQPVCLPGGTCAECATSDDCKAAAKPICDTSANVCVACTRDDQCQSKVGGPGVCMYQQDGHCATDAESVYVGKTGAGICSDAGAGSAQMPYCTATAALDAAKSAAKPVVVVLGQVQGPFALGSLSASLTIVGRSAVIKPVDNADGIAVTGGEVYLRALTVAGNPSGITRIGVNAQADTGASIFLHMDGCTISNNPGGGILLAGASFDIRNSAVTGNGPGQTTGGTIWGGIRIDSLPVAGQSSLNLVTIQNNFAPGLTCSGAIQGQGVLASGNTPLDIATSCGVVPCATPTSTCGAQP
jgi:hypothetical protein